MCQIESEVENSMVTEWSREIRDEVEEDEKSRGAGKDLSLSIA